MVKSAEKAVPSPQVWPPSPPPASPRRSANKSAQDDWTQTGDLMPAQAFVLSSLLSGLLRDEMFTPHTVPDNKRFPVCCLLTHSNPALRAHELSRVFLR